jgi:hypothetical protein
MEWYKRSSATSLRQREVFFFGESDFTLNKVDLNLRTDALCRRAMEHYMTFEFPYKFTRVWFGVPNDIFRPDFVQFFQSLFHRCCDSIGGLNKTEIDDLAEYEFSLETMPVLQLKLITPMKRTP